MFITGTIIYDPVHRVSEKKEFAVRRTYLITGLKLLLETLPHSPPASKVGKAILTAYLDNPSQYLPTVRNRISNQMVEDIYRYLGTVASSGMKPEPVALQAYIQELETRLCRTKTKPWTAIIRVDNPEFMEQYRQKLKYENVTVTPSAWGPHITLIRGEQPTPQGEIFWGFREGQTVDLQVMSTPKTNHRGYWWIDIKCKELNEYRKELGLNPRPTIQFHLTIGKEVQCTGH